MKPVVLMLSYCLAGTAIGSDNEIDSQPDDVPVFLVNSWEQYPDQACIGIFFRILNNMGSGKLIRA